MHARLYPISGTSLPTLFLAILARITVHLWWLWAALVGVDLGFAALARLLTPVFAAALALPLLVLLIGLALHETGHLYVLRLRSRDPAAGRLLVGPGQLGIVRPAFRSARDEVLVACAGPTVALCVGVAAAVPGWLLHAWLLLGCGLLLCAHVVCLGPWWSDGRAAWEAIRGSTRSPSNRIPSSSVRP
jgi:hypothetical protein